MTGQRQVGERVLEVGVDAQLGCQNVRLESMEQR